MMAFFQDIKFSLFLLRSTSFLMVHHHIVKKSFSMLLILIKVSMEQATISPSLDLSLSTLFLSSKGHIWCWSISWRVLTFSHSQTCQTYFSKHQESIRKSSWAHFYDQLFLHDSCRHEFYLIEKSYSKTYISLLPYNHLVILLWMGLLLIFIKDKPPFIKRRKTSILPLKPQLDHHLSFILQDHLLHTKWNIIGS